MSYIDKLLQGQEVQWKTLGEVTKLEKGRQLNKKDLSDKGLYPAYNGGTSFSGFTDLYNYSANKIIISQGGASAGFVNYITTDFYANAHCYVVLPDETQIVNRYLYHFLKLNQTLLMGRQHGAGIPALNASKILELSIPVPPISVQEKIVEILDKFTELEAELEAELDCRKRQYAYYRTHLLDFSDKMLKSAKWGGGNLVQWKSLGEVVKLERGRVISKTYLEENKGPYPVYSSQTSNRGQLGAINTFDFNQEAITWTTDGANAGTVFYRSGMFSITNVCGIMTIYDSKQLDYKYLYYYLSIEAPKYVHKGMGNPKLMSHQISRIPIPVPPISVQEKIVKILDKFDTLTNSITEGLPKEIELRRKQYEYYRNQLLSFPEHKTTA